MGSEAGKESEEGVSGNLSVVPATEGTKPETATLVQSESVPPFVPVLLSEGPSRHTVCNLSTSGQKHRRLWLLDPADN